MLGKQTTEQPDNEDTDNEENVRLLVIINDHLNRYINFYHII